MMQADRMSGGMRVSVAWLVVAAWSVAPMQAQESTPTPVQLVRAMIAHENDEAAHRDRYEFLSEERSERTGGHRWTERVVETAQGRVRLLIAEDGKPLPAARVEQERARLAAMMSDSSGFERQELARRNDEAQARHMLEMLPRAFLFDNVRLADGVWRMDFHPDPDYAPSGLEERVLHGMSGWLTMDAQAGRLMHIEGQLPQDVSIGFGLLATIHAGSRFASDRRDIDGHWRTAHVLTDIRGKAALFKTVSRSSEVTRSEFVYLPQGTTVAEAAVLVEKSRE